MAKAVKLSEELVEIARREGRVMYRSIGAQVEYWARIGREVEATRGLGIDAVRKLLEGVGSVQNLSEADTALYMDLLEQKFSALDGSDTRILDDLRAGGHPIAASDGKGNVIIERPPRERSRS
jgi:hypothetical protein